eukprot:ANDGO_06960.mRNA.1 Protein DENND6 homolog
MPELPRKWFVCFSLVNFHLEDGQRVELVHPDQALAADALSELAFVGLPEFSSECISPSSEVESVYVCTFRRYFVGVHFFRYVDSTSKRRYSQRSVCIVSRFPFVRLLGEMAHVVGSEVVRRIRASSSNDLEASQLANVLFREIAEQIASWPDVISDTSYPQLCIGSHSLAYRTPVFDNSVFSVNVDSQQNSFLTGRSFAFQDCEIGQAFSSANAPHLWHIWEILIREEPLWVLAPTPHQSSAAVFAIVSIISPLRFQGILRPYTTIHDSEFKSLSSIGVSGSYNAVVGATNPFFTKAFADWPNFVSLGDDPRMQEGLSSSTDSSDSKHWHVRCFHGSIDFGQQGSSDSAASETPKKTPHKRFDSMTSSFSFSPFRTPKKLDKRLSLTEDFKKRFNASSKPILQVDKSVISSLVDDRSHSSASVAANSATLRRYFSQLTNAFLLPLQLAFQQIWNSKSLDILICAEVHNIFPSHTFLAYVKTHGYDQKMLQGSEKAILALYESFVETQLFESFLIMMWRSFLISTLEICSIDRLCSMFLNKSDVQKIDVCLRITDLQDTCKSWNDMEMVTRLETLRKSVIQMLPLALQSPLSQA